MSARREAEGVASNLSHRIIVEAAACHAKLEKLFDEADEALDRETCERVEEACSALDELIEKTPAQSLATALLKLKRIPDGFVLDHQSELFKDAMAVIEREMGRRVAGPEPPA
jgi:hypothetical protein